ncbi:hypothetical protein NEOLI_003631 [Neolecta irregularis DAH-3]|uniref:Uncharacterized protein n=1 Tax=Neolecta irregularis (strain DAH-3) TaxID=1198029 RepID=A0A1U7LHZ8_NEOID|nr:hypothetical protein NEOLI_003631 [Neolecta irregularis DAH-3]|eukprot:OLL22277.1 hypothetical protein NEOLI_003631 [Neolecta irregularis DAH-3]
MVANNSEELQRVWGMVEELCQQLSLNREYSAQLARQANNLKAQIGNGVGQSLVSAGLSPEAFESEVVQKNTQLLETNKSLREENEELTKLIAHYERGMENVVAKMRNYAARPFRKMIHKEYSAQLEREQACNEQLRKLALDREEQLKRVSALIREAYKAETELEPDILSETLSIENRGLKEMLGIFDAEDEIESCHNASS